MRPSVGPSTSQTVTIKFYQKHHWDGNWDWKGFSRVGSEFWFLWQQIVPIDLQWENIKKSSPNPQDPELAPGV